jgi:hypothetical protein
MKSSRLCSPSYMRDEESLSQFETFDDLLSEHTLRDSQTYFHTPCTLDNDAYKGTSFEKLLESLSKDLLSTTKDSEEMKPLFMYKKQDSCVIEEDNTTNYAPTFCTAGKKIPVVPKQASLNFVKSLFPIENEANADLTMEMGNETHDTETSSAENGSEEHLHNMCALSKSYISKMKNSSPSNSSPHMKRHSRIAELKQHQNEQTLSNSLSSAQCSIEFNDCKKQH